MWESFNTLEIWEDCELKYEYGVYQYDTLPKQNTTYEQLDKYINDHIKFVDNKKLEV